MPDFRPTQDRVIVKPIGEAARSATDTRQGEVVAVGPGRSLEGGKPHPVDVKVGERIVFPGFSGSEIEVEGEVYVELPEDEILSVSAE
ncbi:co-chaperone GroES [Kitasatospora sp. NPDC048540]|uniref:GroES family chaperonin n=1 Tax=unclassified Kitasatospora TaxID=2633591 RepID=UPI00053A71C2|nr:co-chaperone GroES [Kitasatospora sp. MBT63]